MAFDAVMGAAMVLFICVSLTWSARCRAAAAPAGRPGEPAPGPLGPRADSWAEFERQFRAYAQGDADRSSVPRGRRPRPA